MAFNKSLAGYFDDVQHIGIPTDDMAKTIAFWEKLGFTSREDIVYRNKCIHDLVRIDT